MFPAPGPVPGPAPAAGVSRTPARPAGEAASLPRAGAWPRRPQSRASSEGRREAGAVEEARGAAGRAGEAALTPGAGGHVQVGEVVRGAVEHPAGE